MVLTDEQKQDEYPGTSLEDSKMATEQNYHDINTDNDYARKVRFKYEKTGAETRRSKEQKNIK